jgi:hypothetical protein
LKHSYLSPRRYIGIRVPRHHQFWERQRRNDYPDNRVFVIENLLVGESDDTIPVVREFVSPGFIVLFPIFMRTAVNLDY